MMKKWTHPDCYAGATWEEYYVLLGRHRDSDSISRSNFTVALKRLGGESETVIVARASHWAVGWVEELLIHESDSKAIAQGNAILAKIEDYPVLDEEAHSQLEWDEAAEYWERSSVSNRLEMIQRAGGISIFAARRAEIPQDDNGSLWELIRPDAC